MTFFAGLDRVPGDPDLYRWADWAELLCYTSASGTLSMTDFAEAIERRRDYLKIEGSQDRDPSKQSARDELSDAVEEGPLFRDRTVEKATSVFNILTERAGGYASAYPYALDASSNEITLLEVESPTRDFYLFLLACSSLPYVSSGGDSRALSSSFEVISKLALARTLPSKAETHLFGTSPANSGRYSGLLVDRIEALAHDLGEELDPHFNRDDFERGDYGDHGLDLVAWIPWGDSLRGRPIFFGQCACTGKWISKQASSSYQRWVQVMTFAVPPISTCYIPFDFRAADGSWYNNHDIHSSVLVDRRRLFQQFDLLTDVVHAASVPDGRLLVGLEGVLGARMEGLDDV